METVNVDSSSDNFNVVSKVLLCAFLHLCFSGLSLGFALFPLLVRGFSKDNFNKLSFQVFAI